jgi:DNA-binding winged helix-turn-helix (wHTH) protein
MIKTADQTFSFAEFEIDRTKHLLLKNGAPVALSAKAFDLLELLAASGGEILSKEEIMNGVWAGSFVEENNLTVHISALRKVLGERTGENRFIATVPGKGYKFVADVRAGGGEAEKEITIESRTVSRVTIEDFETKSDAEAEAETQSSEKKLLEKRRAALAPTIFFPLIAVVVIAAFFAFSRSGRKSDSTDLNRYFRPNR